MDARSVQGLLAVVASLALWVAVVVGVASPLGDWLGRGGLATVVRPTVSEPQAAVPAVRVVALRQSAVR